MKQLVQLVGRGQSRVTDVPVPAAQPGSVLVQVAASLVSVGTERMVVEFAEKNLVGKALARPDLVRKVWDKVQHEGIVSTLEGVWRRL